MDELSSKDPTPLSLHQMFELAKEENRYLTTYLVCDFVLTLIDRGSWMLLESGGGLNQPAPSRSPQNTVKNQKKFFLIF